jgi:hypothetical protein
MARTALAGYARCSADCGGSDAGDWSSSEAAGKVMAEPFGSVILVALLAPLAVAAASVYYLWARERDLRCQAMHACSRCGVPLAANLAATMCAKCERHVRLTSLLGYHLVIAVAVLLLSIALVLSASGNAYEAWGGIVLGSIGGARALQLANRIRRHIDSGIDA